MKEYVQQWSLLWETPTVDHNDINRWINRRAEYGHDLAVHRDPALGDE
jgi:hypothetical protein